MGAEIFFSHQSTSSQVKGSHSTDVGGPVVECRKAVPAGPMVFTNAKGGFSKFKVAVGVFFLA